MNDAFRPDPVAHTPRPSIGPPVVAEEEVRFVFERLVDALRALSELRDESFEGERIPSMIEYENAYRAVYRAFGEVERTPLSSEEKKTRKTHLDLLITGNGGSEVRRIARSWADIGATVAHRLFPSKDPAG